MTGMMLAPVAANAQLVKYGDLEEMFGEPVTTSATGKPQKVSEAPANMEIITSDDIRRSGADNIPDVLQYLTGVNFRRSGFNNAELSIRGYDQPWNPRLLVLINGQPVYEDFFGDVVWPAIPVQLEEIRQIEVVKGPNAALFGFNAASGVINIVTFDPLSDSVNSLTARYGTQSSRSGSVVATLNSKDESGLRLSAGGMSANEFPQRNIPHNTVTSYYKPEAETFNFDGRAHLSDTVILSANGNTGYMNRNLPPDIQYETDKTWSLRTQLTADTDYGLTNVDVYGTKWRFNFPVLQQANSVTQDVRLSDAFNLGKTHTIRLSAEYKYNEASGQFFNGSTDFYHIYSGGLMWDWAISPTLSFTNAVRQDFLALGMKGSLLAATGLHPNDYNNRTIDATNFNSGLVYQVTTNDTARLLLSRGYQLPSLNILGMQIPQTNGGVFSGDPHIHATEVTNYEVDFDHSISKLDAALRAAIFHQTNRNLFGFLIAVPNSNSNNLVSSNIGSSDETGLELSLKSSREKGLRWSLGYSYATIADNIGTSGVKILAEPFSVFKNGTPHHTINGGLGYGWEKVTMDLRGGWRSSSQDWQFSSTDFLYHSMRTKAYSTVDLHVGYAVMDFVTLGLTVDQLTQSYTYERRSGDPLERRVFGSVTFQY